MQKDGITKTWLKMNNCFYPNQKAATHPYTHSIIFGGMAVLQDKLTYEGLYQKLALDIVQDEGRVPLCERFPCIYGDWKREDYYPPPHLILRTLRAFQIPLNDVPEIFLTPTILQSDPRVDRSKNVDWRECILAVDLDYGEYDKAYDMKEILNDVTVFQQVIQECGGSPMSSRCIVCVADQGGSLGVHLYFPFSAYFPEECFYLVNFALWKLRETRPIHTKQSKKEWESIVDVSIYDKTLRLPLLFKVKKCKECLKLKKESEKLLCECKGAGFMFIDRRYWPYGILHSDGTLHEQEWMQAITHYICAKKPFTHEPQWMKTALSTNLSRTMTEKKCVDFVYALLSLCSIRIIKTPIHSVFASQPSLPKPSYPRAWTDFFQSIIVQMQKPMVFPTTDYKEYGPVGTKEPKSNQILMIECSPWSNPAGKEMSTFGSYLNQAKKESLDNEQERMVREKFSQFLVAPSAPLNKETINHYKEFHSVDKPITPTDDPFQKCLSLQKYIRHFTHSEYKELQVVKVTHSSKYGNTLVLVQGLGQHFCMMAGRHHRNNTIFFLITRNDQSLSQRCHHTECKGKGYNWKKITSAEVRILFTPKEDLVKKDLLTPDLTFTAEQVIKSSKALSTPCEKKAKRSRARKSVV